MSGRASKSPPVKATNLDDWETDPDFISDMDEIDQRWGSKRTVGSINMNELIDEVRKDHKILREKYNHPSQRDHSEGFGGKFGIQHDRKDQSAQDYDYHEKLSKHTSQEISSHKIITSSSSSVVKGGGSAVSDAKRTFLEKMEAQPYQKSRSPPTGGGVGRSSENISDFIRLSRASNLSDRNSSSAAPTHFEESSSSTKRVVKETSSSSAKGGPVDMPPVMQSIQEKINAFKKELDDMESKVAKRSDLSKMVKKMTNIEKSSSSNVEYISRSSPDDQNKSRSTSKQPESSSRPSSTSPSSQQYRQQASSDLPKTSIKSLSEKFETLCREDSEQFKRRTEERRKEFFGQIKNQVRESRKELEGFDPIDDDDEDDAYDATESRLRGKTRQADKSVPQPVSASNVSGKQFTSNSPRFTPSPSSRPSSRLSSDSLHSPSVATVAINKPKVYTRRETTQEKIVSKIVKENDKIIVDETKRNVEQSSSCHGSSDEEGHNEDEEPNSIRFIDRKLRASPQQRTESPIERLKRDIPVVEPEIKGAGLMARTLFDYQAQEGDELSFDVDDLITNIEKVDSGWYKGTITYKNGKKQVGLFPANYARLLNDTGEY